MHNIVKKIQVDYEERIDKYIKDHSTLSRAEVQKLIANKAVMVNDILVRKANFVVKKDQEIIVKPIQFKPIKAVPEPLDLDIVYEDEDIIVINKKSGIVVHPAPGNYSGTLVSGLLHKYKTLSTIDQSFRPGVVHRLDKDTSGLLVFAKNNQAHKILADQLKEHKIIRIYYALVEGHLSHKITHINLPIGRNPNSRLKMAVTPTNSKSAVTHIFVKKVVGNFSLIRCQIETGRTHQIRVHLSHIGHPIVGDPVYGHKIDNFGQYLHASQLTLMHPKTQKMMTFKAELPVEFNNFLTKIGG